MVIHIPMWLVEIESGSDGGERLMCIDVVLSLSWNYVIVDGVPCFLNVL